MSWGRAYEAADRAFRGGLYDAALADYRLAEDSARKTGDQQALSDSLRGLAKTLIELGKIEEAQKAAAEADAVDREFWGYENHQVAEDMFLMAESMRRLSNFAGARELFERVLTLRVSFFGEAHDDSLAVMVKLILLDLQEDRRDSLVEHTRRAAEVFSRLHPSGTFVKSLRLADLLQPYVDEQRFEDVDAISRQIHDALSTVLGDNHPEVRYALQDCSVVMKAAGRQLAAWQLQSRADVLEKKESESATETAPGGNEGSFAQAESTSDAGQSGSDVQSHARMDAPGDPVQSVSDAQSHASTETAGEARQSESDGANYAHRESAAAGNQSASSAAIAWTPRRRGNFLATALTLAGSDIKPSDLLSIWMLASAAVGSLSSLVYFMAGHIFLFFESFVAGFLFSTAAFGGWLLIAVSSHQKRLAAQIPDALEIIVASLKAGTPITDIFKVLSETSPLPIKKEFEQLVTAMREGQSLKAALKELTFRVRSQDLNLFCDAIQVSKDTGGNLAGRVSTIAESIRTRQSGHNTLSLSDYRMSSLVYVSGLIGIFAGLNLAFNPGFGAPILGNFLVRILLFLAAAPLGYAVLSQMDGGEHGPLIDGPAKPESTSAISQNIKKVLDHLHRIRMQDRISLEFSDFVDMVVMYVESGSSLPQSIHKVLNAATASCPTLCRELESSLADLKSSKSPIPTAFKQVGEKYDLKELAALAGTIEAAERTKSSIAYQLREQSKVLRAQLESKRKARMAAGFTIAMGVGIVFAVLLQVLSSIFGGH